MAIGATTQVRHGHAHGCRPRDGAAERPRRASRDRLDLGTQASTKLDLTVEGVEVGEQVPVKVKKSGFTVRGTATVNKMNEDGCEFEIQIRDRIFGKKVEKDVSVSVEKKPGGGYEFTKDENGKVQQGDVARIRVEGQTTRMTVPDADKGRMVEIQFTNYGNGRFRIRGDDFTADFNA
ncbi:MAG: hypothetical protein FJZ01_25205 [Candidatus Sericytochromatia bacterium]|nr:hypothetical protein [Candidatus Tanganyikabacteria bacterium]